MLKVCEKCGAEAYRVESQFCAKCGGGLIEQEGPRQNICTNEECNWHKTKFIYPDDSRFCDVCGSPTVYASK
jgi:rRNA maturation endonuclease Nob1